MEVYKMINGKRIASFILGIILFIVLIIAIIIKVVLNRNIVNNSLIENVEEESTIDYYEFTDERWAIGYEVAKKNGDWSKLPLSDKFREKYNEKDGILGKDVEYDDIEYAPLWAQGIDERFDGHKKFFVISQGKSKIGWIYIIFDNEDGLVDDVYLYEKFVFFDENGNEVGIPKYTYYDIWGISYFNKFNQEENSIEVTDSFRKKYPHFIDLFIHYSPIDFNIVKEIEDASEYNYNNKKMATIEIDSILEAVRRYYKVDYTIDDDGRLDDATSTLLKEEKYEMGKSENKRSYADLQAKILYPNSDWSKEKLTDNFKLKYNSKKGIFPDPDMYNYNGDNIEYKGNNSLTIENFRSKKLYDDWILYAYLLKDGHYHYYARKDVYVEKEEKLIDGRYHNIKYLDDILWEKLPYIDIDSEEARKMYMISKRMPEDYTEKEKTALEKEKDEFIEKIKIYADKMKDNSIDDIQKIIEESEDIKLTKKGKNWLKEYYDLVNQEQ